MEFTDIQIVFFAVVLLVVVNVGSAIAVWWDKRRASKGQWRVKEEMLLVWALIGGWPGGIWAMRRFRHKTSKRSFIVKYVFVVVLNLELSLAIAFAAIA